MISKDKNKRWNAVCGEIRTHGVKWGKIPREYQRITYHYQLNNFFTNVRKKFKSFAENKVIVKRSLTPLFLDRISNSHKITSVKLYQQLFNQATRFENINPTINSRAISIKFSGKIGNIHTEIVERDKAFESVTFQFNSSFFPPLIFTLSLSDSKPSMTRSLMVLRSS